MAQAENTGVAGNRLGTQPIGKLLLEFSIPAIAALVFNQLYNVVDAMFLGAAVGPDGVAVATLAMPVTTVALGLAALAGQGGAALAALKLGEGRADDARATLGSSAVLLVLAAILVAFAATFFMEPLLAILGTTPALHDSTALFVGIICYGFIFQSLGVGLNNFLRTAGRPNLALGTMALGTGACVAFNWLFVMVMGMGVAGSALATVCGQACGAVPVLRFFLTKSDPVFHLEPSSLRIRGDLVGRILSLGMASFILQVAFTAVNVVLDQMVALYGAQSAVGAEGALAAIGSAQRVIVLAATPLAGITMGMQPIVGYNYGARSWQRVLDALKWSCIAGTVLAAAFSLAARIAPAQIMGIFGLSGNLLGFAADTLVIQTLAFPIVGFQVVGSSYFQSSGQPLKASLLELTRQVIFLIPLLVVLPLVLPGIFGIDPLMAVVWGIPVGDTLATATSGVFVVREIHKLRRLRDGGGCAPADGAPAGSLIARGKGMVPDGIA